MLSAAMPLSRAAVQNASHPASIAVCAKPESASTRTAPGFGVVTLGTALVDTFPQRKCSA